MDISCSCIGKVNVVKMFLLPKSTDSMHLFKILQNSFEFKIQNDVFHITRTNNSKICMECQKISNSQNNLEKEKQSWRYHAP